MRSADLFSGALSMHDQLTLQTVPGSPAPAAPTGLGSPVVMQWTGREIRALRMTNERFVERLGVGARAVSKWNTHPGHVVPPELQRAMDTVLESAPAPAWERFALILTALMAGEVA